ncbi:MAG: RICIN domain-containing protein [bacterium]|nr:RICIN domain-containing protein [bacterium]
MLITILQINNYFSVSVKAGTSDLAGLESGTTYYIINVYTGKYLDVQGGTDKNGQNVIVYNCIGGNNQKWKLKRISGYIYTFLTKLSSARAMNVSSSNIDIKNDSSASSQKFVLSRYTDGRYYIKYGSKYVVVTDGKNVGLSTSTSNAKWSFDEVTKSDADIYGFKYKNGKILFFDTTGCYSQFKSGFSSAGYSTYAFTNKPASTAYNYMKSDSIFIFSGHGVYTGTKGTIAMATIAFFDSNGNWQKTPLVILTVTLLLTLQLVHVALLIN